MFDLWDRNHFVDVVGMWHLSVFLRNADKWKKALLHNWHVVVLVNILHSRNSHRLLHRLNHRNLSLFLKWHRKNLDMLALDLGYCDRLLHHLGHVGNVILNNLSLPLNWQRLFEEFAIIVSPSKAISPQLLWMATEAVLGNHAAHAQTHRRAQ